MSRYTGKATCLLATLEAASVSEKTRRKYKTIYSSTSETCMCNVVYFPKKEKIILYYMLVHLAILEAASVTRL